MGQWLHNPVISKTPPLTIAVLGTNPAFGGVAFKMQCSVSITQQHLYQNLAMNWVVWEQGNHFCDVVEGKDE